MATTRATLRKQMQEAIGDYRALTTTASSATTVTTVTSAAFADYAEDADAFPYWYVMFITGTTNLNASRPIKRTSGYATTNVATVTRAYPGAIASGDSFELSRYNPDFYHNALLRAAEVLFDKTPRSVFKVTEDESLVVDNILANSDFESALSGSAHPSWTNALNGGSTALETTRIRHGASSASITSPAGDVAQIHQSPTINIRQVTGQRVVFKMWVYVTAASTARIRVSFDGGSTYTSSSYHSGKDQWELLSVDNLSVPDAATGVRFVCEVAAGAGTAYFDAGWAYIRPVYRYTIPSTFALGKVYQVLQQEDENHPDGMYYPLSDDNPPIPGRRLRLKGRDILTRPTTDATSMEVTGNQINIVTAQALAIFYKMLQGQAGPGGSNNPDYALESAKWQTEADRLLKEYGMLLPTAHVTDSWKVERDGETSRLSLQDYRG